MEPLNHLSKEDRESVREINVNWDRILDESVIVDLKITKWHPFVTIGPDDMRKLGVQLNDKTEQSWQRAIKLGRMCLIPDKIYNGLQSTEKKGRNNLENLSHHTYFGRAVHANGWNKWKERDVELRREFMERVIYVKRNIIEGDCLYGQMEADYRNVFSDAYDRMISSGTSIPTSKREFVQDAIDYVLGHIPSIKDIADRFSWETTFSFAPAMDHLASRKLKAEEMRAQAEFTKEATDVRLQSIVGEMRAEVEQHASKLKSEVEATFFKAEREFYDSIKESCGSTMESIRRNSSLPPRTSMGLKSLVDRVRALNVFGNDKLAGDIDELSNLIEARAGKMSEYDKDENLQDIFASLSTIGHTAREGLGEVLPSRERGAA